METHLGIQKDYIYVLDTFIISECLVYSCQNFIFGSLIRVSREYHMWLFDSDLSYVLDVLHSAI